MMRLNHWLATLAGILAIACGVSSARAQYNPFSTPTRSVQSEVGSIAVRSQSPMGQPPGYGPGVMQAGYNPYGGVPPAYVGADPNYCPPPMGVAPAPPNPAALPWPGISPFEHRFAEHRNDHGLWTLETNDAARKYFVGVGAMLFKNKAPERGIIGDPHAAGALGQPTDFDREILPVNGDTVLFQVPIFNEFKTEGIRFNWGYWDPDDTGLEVIAWWGSEVKERFRFPPTFSELNPAQTPGPVIPALQIDGRPIYLFYDGHFKAEYSQELWNTQIQRMARPMFRWNDILVVRPMYGARYFGLRERQNIHAFDFLPAPGFGFPDSMFINNSVTSHMAGPQIGLHGTLGEGSFLKVTFGTQFILFVNHERQKMNGFNFGSQSQRTGRDGITQNDPFFNDAAIIPAGARFFSDSRNTTHISPAFEQTVHFDMKLFSLIPWVNRMDLFKNATVRGGLTFLDVGLVTRPSKSISYVALPGRPNLRTDRSNFWTLAWDVGVQFTY